MTEINDFFGGFGDFGTFFHDTNLDSRVIRFYVDGDIAMNKIIVGYTELPNDILLHMIDVDNCIDWEDYDEMVEKGDMEFQLLSKMLGDTGFEILDRDQLVDDWVDGRDEDEDEDEDEDKGCNDYDCDTCKTPTGPAKPSLMEFDDEVLGQIFAPYEARFAAVMEGKSKEPLSDIVHEFIEDAAEQTGEELDAEAREALDGLVTMFDSLQKMMNVLGDNNIDFKSLDHVTDSKISLTQATRLAPKIFMI